MKKYKSLTKIIATFMAFIIAFIAMPTQAIALYIDDSEVLEENIVIENNSEVEQAEVFIVEEDTSKRGQFEKHYLCSDGTYVSVTYPEAVHYLDNNQVWQDVDQSLTYDSKTRSYKSEKADFKVSFSETFSTTNIAQIERNGYSLSWGIQTAKKTAVEKTEIASVKPNIMEFESMDTVITPSLNAQAQVISTPAVEFDNFSDRLISREDSFALPDISSQISYSDVLNGSENVSVRYTVYHNKIEEDIIISDRGDISSVSMNMDIGTLTPVVNADRSVDLVDADGNMQFRIGIPYMMDADFSVCNDISVTAEKVGSTCIITYTPDLEWFSSEDRVFPIVLDPSVTTNDYVSNIEDTYVEQNSTANHTSEQYLQIYPNGTNRRNAVVRITTLPVIDESMPIVSARLTLTTQYTPFSSVYLKAGFYYCSSVDLDEYTYELTTASDIEYTSYSYLNAGATTVGFDVSSYIYEMYSSEQYYNKYGSNDIYADFIVGYASDTDTTFLYPFFSSEYTVPANRPVFTVRYGYTLPAGILNGQIYSFQNYASYSYMSVNTANPANNSNIYQLRNDSNVALTTQKFKLEYVSATGGYLLRSLSSSSGTDKVVSIDRNGGEITGGQNVRLSSPSDSISQEWLIIPVDYNVFKIVPRANMNYALTVYLYSDGTNTGTGALSAGNIFIQTYGGSDNFQHWYVYDNSNNQLDTSQYRAEVETGDYYISNYFTGKYLHRSGNVANCMRGKKLSLGKSTVKWKIVNLGDGYCTIQRYDTPHCYLVPTNDSNGSGVRIYNSASETIPDNCKWSIRLASGGGCLIQNKATGYYLSATSSTNNPSSVYMYSLQTSGTAAYQRQIWRIAHKDDYVELDNGISFNDFAIDVGETKAASINKKPSNAYWSTYRDFDYTITSGSEYVSYDESTHKFTGIAPGTATVTATHKTTGISWTLEITVYRSYSVVLSYISDLYNAALTYAQTPETALLLTMQFIRRERYSGESWTTVGGEIDTTFVNYIYNNYPILYAELTIVGDDYFFVDPNGMGEIDIAHLCATLNGLLFDSTGFKSAVAGEENIDNLCGWAGDLQTLCIDVLNHTNNSNDYDTIYEATILLLGNHDNSASSFSMSDLLADVDAYNLYSNLCSNGSSSNFISIFDDYYQSLCMTRFTDFSGSRTRQEMYDCVRLYTTNTFFLWVDWPLLNGYSITSSQSDAIAQAFTDYIWGLIQNENQ